MACTLPSFWFILRSQHAGFIATDELINSLLNAAILKAFQPPQDAPVVNIFFGFICLNLEKQ